MNQSAGGVLRRSLNDFLHIELDEAALNRLQWRDFGNGLSMARLAREDARELVLYRTAADASPDAFVKHEHIGGEFYLVLKGKIADETGGGYFELTKASELAPTFTKVAQELHSQYVLGFTPTALDNKVHKLAVKLKQPGMTAQARRSYLAAGDKMSVTGK